MPRIDDQAPVRILSCSLNPDSLSHRLALAAAASLADLDAPHELVDLREWNLPLCDGGSCFEHPSVAPLTAKVASASAILIASPVYNYDLNASAKNVVELTGKGWAAKPVGFLCAAGGSRAYMAPIGLANSLMFDFRCHIIPRYVYATRDDFPAASEAPPAGLAGRIRQVAQAAVDLAAALRWLDDRAPAPRP